MNFIKGPIHTFEELLAYIKGASEQKPAFLIGIDGCGGSGKSTFARKLRDHLESSTLIHKDDFYLPSTLSIKAPPREKPIGADFDWQRLKEQVLEPLRLGTSGNYQRYDWETDSLAEWHGVPAEGVVIIEGVYSTREELAEFYDLKIFVDCPWETRLARGLERDGEEACDMWVNNWMVAEELYLEKYKPLEKADIVVDGTS